LKEKKIKTPIAKAAIELDHQTDQEDFFSDCLMDSLTLKMGPISCPERFATNCYSTLRKMQEERVS
jgi:hypothetical protein